ncbi:hypothetical protein F5Y16DRAFT_203129 [Xylariaceae sp. FL0255]|nr:hypothetical protein F5Y16DRAFT_203129 [Xylariaceae sp. FL0255]
MSVDDSRAIVRRIGQGGEGNRHNRDQQSVYSIDTPEELVQFHTAEVVRLRSDINAPAAQLVEALLYLGTVLADHPDLGDAEPALREAHERMRDDKLASYRGEEIVFVQTLALVLQRRDEFDAAISLYTEALKDTQHSRGREHPWTLELQNNLGCLWTAAGVSHKTRERDEEAKRCFDEAAVLFKKSYKAKARVFGISHRTTWKARCNTSIVSFLSGDASALETDLLAASQGLSLSYGKEDSDTKQSATHLASVYQKIGNNGRAVEISVEFGVDPPEDYEICPFKDTMIPGLPILRRSTSQTPDVPDEAEELPVEILRNVLDVVDPTWGKHTVEILTWARDKIKIWTGMDVNTFMKAMGFSSMSGWSVVTKREVLLEQAAAVGHFLAVELLLTKMREGPSLYDADADKALVSRALHRAVESGSGKVVKLFLDYGVKPLVTDEEGKPALHKAAELGLEDVLVELAQSVDDIDSRDKNGDTALDYALRGNHEVVIRFLMREKGALLASSKSSTEGPDTEKKRSDETAIGVFDSSIYTGLDATVVNFYVDHKSKVEEHRIWTKPVEAVVSDQNLLRNIIDDDGITDEKPDITWIHIPANNMFWVEALMRNLAEVSQDRKRYLNLISKEVWHNQLHESLHGSFHGRFMKPYCGKLVGRFSQSTEDRDLAASNRDIVLYMPYIHWESEPMKKEMDKAIQEIESDLALNRKNVKKLWRRYYTPRRKAGEKADEDVSAAKVTPDIRLLETYLYLSGTAPLHVRRTFDQFQYYMNDDTTARDSDQVVSRYFHRRYEDMTIPIMMVDQLWMWVIGNDTIVTCFPKRWDNPEAAKETTSQILDTGNILHSLLDRLKFKFREPVLSNTDLADMIMARCLGLHSDRSQWNNERHRYLEIFEHSINYVADEEIRRFSYFADGGKAGVKAKQRQSKQVDDAEASSEEKKRQGRILLAVLEGAGASMKEAEEIVDRATRRSQIWGIRKEEDIDEIFDISDEIELLKEIKDIRDELNILRTLFDQQKGVVESFSNARGGHHTAFEMYQAVERLSGIVEKMDTDAQKPYKALEDLLDLKQKQANVAEARITRQSGSTITVFTIVTIIFLPASFLAAFFALPIVEFPLVNQMFHLGYAIKWTVSVTAAIAIPTIILALYVNPIMASLRLLARIVQAVAKITMKIIKGIFKATWALTKCLFHSLRFIWWGFAALSLLICLRWPRAFGFIRKYRNAKRETTAKGEEWSKRRYIIGGFLERRLERIEVMDEEKQRRPRSISPRPRSSTRSMTSRSASLVESSND